MTSVQSEIVIPLLQELAATQQWSLIDADVAALANAISPFVAQEEDPTETKITKIALNYYHDGPMFEAMRTPNDTEGEQLWAEWRAYMVSLANNKGLYGEVAEELAQEVYLQTARALEKFRFGSRLKTYFCGIFINCYRHWARSNKSQTQHEKVLAPWEGEETQEAHQDWLVDDTPQPEEAVLERVHGGQVARLVHDEILKLTKSQDFQILRWYYVDQRFIDKAGNLQKWTDEAIGQELDMPLNTVTSRRLRAVRRLKKHPRLQELFYELTN